MDTLNHVDVCIKTLLEKKPGDLKSVAINMLYGNYSGSAKRRGIEFSLSKDDVEKLVTSQCFYCSADPSNTIKRPRINDVFYYNGIDRIIASRGYTLDNCVPCCWKCNRGKSTDSRDEFLLWIKRVYEHNNLAEFIINDVEG